MERQYWKTPTNSGMAKSAKEKQHKFALVKVGRGGGVEVMAGCTRGLTTRQRGGGGYIPPAKKAQLLSYIFQKGKREQAGK